LLIVRQEVKKIRLLPSLENMTKFHIKLDCF